MITNINEFKQTINENVTMTIPDKDWMRMSDLVLSGKDGEGIARTIKDKKKAIGRFIAGLKLSGDTIDVSSYGSRQQYNYNFREFGNRALELGATTEEIQSIFD